MKPDGLSPTMPEHLGPYRLLQILGQGGMSQVFLAVRYGASGFEKKVAIKTLPSDSWDDDTRNKALIEEARLCAKLNHPNLIQVYDLGVDDGIYYLCMEAVDGFSLRTLIQSSKIPVSVTLWIATELLKALDYLENVTDAANRPLRLVHRDINPSNILLSRTGEVKLTDFGIAKATFLSEITWGRFLKGTIAYMSPEQIVGTPLSPQSDQFSLGVVLAEMLTGIRPFDASSLSDMMERIKLAENPELPGLPDDLRTILQTMLAPLPSQRYPSARTLFYILEDYRKKHVPATVFDFIDFLSSKTNREPC